MNRRFLLTSAAATALAACGTQTSQLQAYADLITTGVAVFAPVAEKNATPEQIATIERSVAAVQAADKALATSTGQDATLNAQNLVVAVQAVAPIALALLPAGSTEALAVTAALSLVPALLRLAGVTMAPATARGPVMSEGAAATYLRGLRVDSR